MRKMTKIEVFKGKKDLWYFRLRASNGKIVAQSEGYTQRHNVKNGISAVEDVVLDGNIVYL